MVVSILERLIPLLGAGTEPGQDALESLRKLAKHIPPGTVSPAAQQNQMQQMQMRQAQMRGMMQQPQQPMQQPPAAGAAPGMQAAA